MTGYMGGKWRQGPAIARVVAEFHKPGEQYFEPFSGGMGSAARCVPVVDARGDDSFLSDVSKPVVTMWRAALAGWDPPASVSEEEYKRVKAKRDPDDPMTAFCGFGLSYASRWFGGYARTAAGRNFAQGARTSIARKVELLRGRRFCLECRDYREVTTRATSAFYFDPPYRGRYEGHNCDSFNHDEFWQHARRLVSEGHSVIVTEFSAPDDWVSIFSWGNTVAKHHTAKGVDVNERIFVHRDQVTRGLL